LPFGRFFYDIGRNKSSVFVYEYIYIYMNSLFLRKSYIYIYAIAKSIIIVTLLGLGSRLLISLKLKSNHAPKKISLGGSVTGLINLLFSGVDQHLVYLVV
jgi:hypothetical protein